MTYFCKKFFGCFCLEKSIQCKRETCFHAIGFSFSKVGKTKMMHFSRKSFMILCLVRLLYTEKVFTYICAFI